ncbi:MAG: membrane protein insertion efficiency factor YidD [Nodosilinea sp.]
MSSPVTAYTLKSIVTQAAIASVDTYRTHISPRRGFSCSHRLLHGSESCSGYVRRSLTKQDFATALQSSIQRFKACRTAAQMLQLNQVQGGCFIVPCCIPIPT